VRHPRLQGCIELHVAHTRCARTQTDRLTVSIQTEEHAYVIPFTLTAHYTNSAFNSTNTLVVDSNNTRIIPSSHFNIRPLNQIHCSLFGLTRALAIASQYDLCTIMEDPETFLKQLSSALYNFKLKGSGEVNFHLGCGFERDSDGVLIIII
jgi:hypothetical protein